MASILGRLDKILPIRKAAVRAFIHRVLKHDIPEEVICICMLFYALCDRFDPNCISRNVEFDASRQIIKHDAICNLTSCYLENIVKFGRQKWKFKILRCTVAMLIGIVKMHKNEHPPVDMNFAHNSCGYAYNVSDGKRSVGRDVLSTTYGIKCVDGDVVEMNLDFYDLSLSFKVNGKDYGKSHSVEQREYRAAVCMIGLGDEIQILD